MTDKMTCEHCGAPVTQNVHGEVWYAQPAIAAQEPERDSVAEPVRLEGVEPEDGFWKSCSGCHETVEGQETGHYDYSPVFKCYMGAGCRECGGLGAIWDDTDYEDMARFLREEDASAEPARDSVAAVPCGGCGEIDPGNRCIGCRHDFGDQSSAWVREDRDLSRAED